MHIERTGGILGAEIEQHVGRFGKERGVALEHGRVGDVAGQHGLAQALGGDEDEIVPLAHEVAAERSVDHPAVDLRGPVPVEFVDGLEAPEVGGVQSALQRAPLALAKLLADQLFEHNGRAPAPLGGSREEVVEIGGRAGEPE
jgi:hypothetical protein